MPNSDNMFHEFKKYHYKRQPGQGVITLGSLGCSFIVVSFLYD